MTGLRLGYAVTRNKIAADLIRKGDYTETAGVVTSIQQAANIAFWLEKDIKDRVETFKSRRDKLYESLKGIEGIEVVKPEGAFYFYPNFAKFIPKDLKQEEKDWYIYRLFLENGIATVPGCCFTKASHFTDNIRFSISATSHEDITEGTERMRNLLKE
jgi:aspartate aminotransferase